MKPDAIQVAVDILRTLGLEDVARWVEHPDAVRALLKCGGFSGHRDDLFCSECGESGWDAHERTCPVAAAWRALGDPRGQADIERAHEEALAEQGRIERGRSPASAMAAFNDAREQRMTATAAAILHDNRESLVARVEQVRRLIEDGHITMHDVQRIVDEHLE